MITEVRGIRTGMRFQRGKMGPVCHPDPRRSGWGLGPQRGEGNSQGEAEHVVNTFASHSDPGAQRGLASRLGGASPPACHLQVTLPVPIPGELALPGAAAPSKPFSALGGRSVSFGPGAFSST